jgi:F-type H+-transporting ATPase subunit b
MRRSTVFAGLLGAALSASAFAQETQNAGVNSEIWRVANFVILAAGLGYLLVKKGGPFFAARGKKIAEDLIQGEAAKKDAERRAAEVDQRLANLEKEIGALRAEAQTELEKDRERIRQQTAAEIEKVRSQTAREIEAAGKAARAELRRYSAELAIGIAEQKLRSRINADVQDALVGEFVSELDGRLSQAQIN